MGASASTRKAGGLLTAEQRAELTRQVGVAPTSEWASDASDLADLAAARRLRELEASSSTWSAAALAQWRGTCTSIAWMPARRDVAVAGRGGGAGGGSNGKQRRWGWQRGRTSGPRSAAHANPER